MARASKKKTAANNNNSLKEALEKARERVQSKSVSAAGGSGSTSSNTTRTSTQRTGTSTKDWLKNYSERVNNTANSAKKNLSASVNRGSTFQSRAAGVRDYGRSSTLSGAPSADARRYAGYIDIANRAGYTNGRQQKTSMTRAQQGHQDYELRKKEADKQRAKEQRETLMMQNARREEGQQIKKSLTDERLAKRKAELTARANEHLDSMYHRRPGTSAQMQYEKELEDWNEQQAQNQRDLYNQQHLLQADDTTDIEKGIVKPSQDFSKMSMEELLVSLSESNDQMKMARKRFDNEEFVQQDWEGGNITIDENRKAIDQEYAQYSADYMAAMQEYQKRTGGMNSEEKRDLSERLLKQYSGNNAIPNTYESFFGDNSERKRKEALKWANENILASDAYYSGRQDMWNSLSKDDQEYLKDYVKETQMNPYGSAYGLTAKDFDKERLNKIYGKLEGYGYDQDEVDEFVNRLNYADLSEARQQRIEDRFSKHPVLAGLGYSAESILTNLGSGLDVMPVVDSIYSGYQAGKEGDILKYHPVDTNQMMLVQSTSQMRQYTGDTIEQKFGGAARLAYDAAMSSADSALGVAIGTLLGGEYFAGKLVGEGATEALSLGLMATQATANDALQQIESGATPQEAMQHAIIAGMIEVLTEKFSVDAFINLRNSRNVKAFVSNALKSMMTEGSEEMASDLLNLVADRMTGYEKSDENVAIANYMQQGLTYDEAKNQYGKDFLKQVFMDGLAGALSGGFGTGHALIQGKYMGMRTAQEDIKSGSAEINAEAAGALAKKYNNESLQKAAEKVQNKQTATNVDNMNIALEDFIQEEIAGAETIDELEQKVKDIKNTEGVSTEIKNMAEYARMERMQQLNEEAGEYDSTAVSQAEIVSDAEAREILEDPYKVAQIENTDAYKASMKDVKLDALPEKEAVEVVKNVVANNSAPGIARNLRARAAQTDSRGGVMATMDTGKEVGIAGYYGQRNGNPLVRTTDGRILPANMLNYDNMDFVTVINQAAANDKQLRTDDMAEAYVGAYKNYLSSENNGGLNATQYMNAMIKTQHEGNESFLQLVNNGVEFSEIVDMIQNSKGSPNLALLKGRISIDDLRNIYNQARQYNKERGIRNKARGAKYTDEQQRTFVKLLSEATGREVEFASPDDMVQLKGANGYVTNDGKIYISEYADQPAVITMTHELVHSIEGTEAYKQLRDFIMKHLQDNPQFQEQYEKRKAQYELHTGREMSQEEIEREMIAYSTELVFRDVSSVDALVKHNRGLAGRLADFIGRFSKRLGRSIREYEKEYGVSEESRMMGTDRATLAEFRERLLDALEKGSQEIKEKGQPAKSEEGQYDLVYFPGGLSYVDVKVDQKEFDGLTESQMRKKARQKIREKFRGKYLGTKWKLYLNERSAGEYTYSADSRKTEYFEPKMRASTELDNISDASYYFYHGEDGEDGHFHDFVTDGWDNYVAVFKVGEKYYEGIIRVAKIKKGDLFYDITKLKDITNSYKNLLDVDPNVLSTGNISNQNIAQNSNNGKQNQNNEQNSLQRDSGGRDLSDQQWKYFKDSKVTDENGNLLVMYHGTPRGGFNTFLNGLQFFTENKKYADNYQNPSATSRTAGKEATSPQTYEVYLNITNPFDIRDPEIRDQFINDYVKGGYALGINPYEEYKDTTKTGLPSWEEADNIYEWMEENDLLDTYDGLIVDEGSYQDENGKPVDRGISYVTFSPEQVKNVSNTAPTKNEDIRFSLQRPLEETRDLVAVHNIKQDEFLKSAGLGGFAMPSLAIVKAQAGHNQFGDISLVFDKNTIDPSRKRNKVYGGDAWTPTFPTIYRKLNSDAFTEIRNELRENKSELENNGIYDEISRFLNEYAYEEDTYKSREDIIEQAAGNDAFKQWYLATIGQDVIDINDYKSETRTDYGDDIKWLAENVPALQALYDNRRENKEQYFATIREALTDFYQEQFGFSAEEAQNVLNNTRAISLHNMVSKALKYQNGQTYDSKTETDYNGFNKALNDAVDEKSYQAWLNDLFKDIVEKEGLYNGKDRFTASGNRRSFEALHYEVNLENIVRAMMLQEEKGGGSLTGGNILAVAARNYQSVDEIKADEKRLGKISDEEYEALKQEYNHRFTDIVSGLVNNKADNWFIDFDTKAGVILDALRDYPDSKMGIYKEMKKYIPGTTMDVVDQIVDLCRNISEMPTGYFEAKPQRVVTFEEVKAALVPDTASAEVVQALNDYNVPIVQYEAENDEDRTEKLNNIEQYIGQDNIKFSLQKDEAPAAEKEEKESGKSDLERLRYSLNRDGIDSFWFDDDILADEQQTAFDEAGSILEEGFKAFNEIGDVTLHEKEAKKFAKELIEKYGSNYSVSTLAGNIQAVFSYADKNDIRDYKNLVRIMTEVTKPVIENAKFVDPQQKAMYDRFRKDIKTRGIRLTEKQKEDVKYTYGNISNYRNRLLHHGIHLNNNGMVLDGSVWAELVDLSGYQLDLDTSDTDTPMQLLEALDRMEPVPKDVYGMNNTDIAFDAALTIYTNYFENKNVELKNQLRQSLEKMRDAQHQAYKEQLKAVRIQMAQEAKKTENRLRMQIEELEKQSREAGVEYAERMYYEGEISRFKKLLKDQQEKARSDLNDAVAVERARNRTSLYNQRQRQKKTELKHQIEKLAMDLNQRLGHSRGDRYVPETMVRAAIEVAEAVNLDTGKNKGFMSKLHKLQASYQSLKEDPAFQYDYDDRTAANIARLTNIFEDVSIADLNINDLQEVKQILKEVQHQIIVTRQLIREEQNIAIRGVAEKVLAETEKTKGISDKKIVSAFKTFELNSLNPRRFFRYISGYQKDASLIRDGGEINYMTEYGYGELNKGQRRKMVYEQEASQIFKDVLSQPKALADFSTNKIKNWVDTGLKRSDGSKVLITKGMRVSLAMHAMNEDSLRHIIYGGINVPNAKLFRSGNIKEAYNRSEIIKLVDTDKLRAAMYAGDQDTIDKIYAEGRQKIKAITENMTDYEKEWLEASKKYFHDFSGRKVNETSRELKGYNIATLGNYFPISVDKNFLDTNFDLITDLTVAGQGFTKERVKSYKPIYLEDVANVVARSKEQVGNYVGFAIAIRNFQKLYNFNINGTNWKGVLNQKWGMPVVNYIENMLKDIQGARRQDATVFDKIRSNYAQAVLTFNPSVTIKQAASYPTAAATLGWKPIMKALAYVERQEKNNAVVIGRAELDLIAKYTPYLDYRSSGRAMEETADLKEAMARHGILHDIEIRHPKLTKGLMGWIEGVDKMTVGRLWYASQYYVDEQHIPHLEKGSDVYYKMVARVFELMVEDTQPNYTVLQRTGFSRNPNALLKQMLMFKTQTFQNLGIKFDALMNFVAMDQEYRQAKKSGKNLKQAKENKKQAASDLFKAYTSQIAQALVFSTMTFAAQLLLSKTKDYRDEEGEVTWLSVLEQIMKDAAKTLGTEIPFSNTLYEMLMSTVGDEAWYDVTIPVTDLINDMQSNMKDITSALEEDDYEALWKAISKESMDLMKYTGVPLENVNKFRKGLMARVQDLSNDGKLNFNSDYELGQIYSKSGKQGNYSALYKSIEKGNFSKEYEKAIEKEIKKLQENEKYQNASAEMLRQQAESNIQSGLLKEIRENDANYQAMVEAVRTGDTSAYKFALEALMKDDAMRSLFGNYDFKGKISYYLKSDLRDEDVRIQDAATARINGKIDDYKKIVDAMKKEGYDQDLIVGAVNSEINSRSYSGGGGSGSSEDQAQGLFTTKDLQYTVNNGDADDVQDVVQDLIKTKIANGKDEEDAFYSVKSSVKKQLEDEYRAADTVEDKEKITGKLLKLEYDGKKIFTNKDFNSWYELDDEEQGLITNPIYRSYAKGDMKTHNKLLNEEFNELVAQGKSEKEITTALRTDVTSSNHWKKKYKEAYDRGDTNEMAKIESYIYSVTVAGQQLYPDGYCYKYWRK